ncbi:MAG: DUF4160 domain-containing protein [Bacteroidetes bacterium]|nr:DUF4160 domain-containing protein [Bacteroidota bacterium]
MPTILRYNGFRFCYFSNDHLPVHYHIFYQDGEIVIEIIDKVIEIREIRRMKINDVRKAIEIAQNNIDFLIESFKI